MERESEDDFLYARDGDDLMCPFECDFCSFERLTRREPRDLQHTDKVLLACIRRVRLDAFWSRKSTTVSKTRRAFKLHIRTGKLLGFIPFPNGPQTSQSFDDGLRYAVTLVWKSLDEGRHEDRIKFNSIRHIRSMATNVEAVLGAQGFGQRVYVKGLGKKIESPFPGDSMWMKRFMAGMEQRMGVRVKQDLGFTSEIVMEILLNYEREWDECFSFGKMEEARNVAEEALFFVFTYAGALRGFEVPKVTLTNLEEQFNDGVAQGLPPYIGVPLTGSFKSRQGRMKNMVFFMAQETKSGIQTGVWIKRLIRILHDLGVTGGWLFQDKEGRQVSMSRFTEPFYSAIERAYESRPDLFTEKTDIREHYGPMRSGRRGADSRLIMMISNQLLIDSFFRWNTGGDETSHLPMHVLYADRKKFAPDFVLVSTEL